MNYLSANQDTPPVINMHEAKTHLSAIVEEVKRLGKPVIIAKAGKPQVKIIPMTADTAPSLMGFLLDEDGKLPIGFEEFEQDFDHKWSDEINLMFSGDLFPQETSISRAGVE